MIQQMQNFVEYVKKSKIKCISAFLIFLFLAPDSSYSQDEIGSFKFDGRIRNYEVYLPKNFQPNMPLVISLHGYSETIQWYKDYTAFHEVADTMGFIVVYPAAIIQAWNTGVIDPNRTFPTDVDDVGFISALIDTLSIDYEIDEARIYACGYSTGGEMSFRLACELGHRFAAVASVAGTLFGLADSWQPIRPFPVIQMHGTAEERFVPYNGRGDMWSVQKTIDYWRDNNQCTALSNTFSFPDIVPGDNCTVQKISWSNCTDESIVIHYKIIGGGHSWPSSKTSFGSEGNKNLDINANVEILNFFRQYTNPLTDLEYSNTKTDFPNAFTLNQNYPNPFNPTTAISYQLPMVSQVELSIYNLLGQKVATLVSEKHPAGNFKVEWDATGFASGVYLYRFTTNNGFIQTKKLILLR